MNLPSAGPAGPESNDTSCRRSSSIRQISGLEKPGISVDEAFLLLATAGAHEAVRRADQVDAHASPEVFHKLRVALRRLRSLWWAYRPLLDEADAERWRNQFKVLAAAAGKTRDWDIVRELLVAYESARHPRTSLLACVDDCRRDAVSFSFRTIQEAGLNGVLERAMDSANGQLASAASKPPLAEFAKDRVKLAEKALERRIKHATLHEVSGYAALHDVRIAGKKLRYLLEFFSPVLGVSHQATIERLKDAQDELGALNDIVASEALLRECTSRFGQPDAVDDAIAYLQDQKKRRIHRAYEMLRAAR
ncbi:CHAD domain containing protein [Burkholderia sp. lig30]|uniref:CHAD domain-containing protein n=1 Tax=Burkholderia sp. lig30 TaxID=1192124 RepID=UPI000461AC6E|nr:CHAD domain-containing protein [Burkholderia sp. lig30]KDB09659.1 CHAD domain containing protein [Burkholderia sp. lig30]